MDSADMHGSEYVSQVCRDGGETTAVRREDQHGVGIKADKGGKCAPGRKAVWHF